MIHRNPSKYLLFKASFKEAIALPQFPLTIFLYNVSEYSHLDLVTSQYLLYMTFTAT